MVLVGYVYNMRINIKKRLSRRSMQSQKCLCFSGVVYIQAREPRSSGVCGRPLVGVGGRFAFNS